MNYAVVRGGRVENVILLEQPEGFSIPGAELIPSGTATIGDLWDGQTFSTPVVDLKPMLLNYAAEARWTAEVAGTVFNGIAVATDRESRSIMSQSVMYLREKPEGETIRWKGPAGWITLDLATLTAATLAAGDHVNRCFAREDEVAEAIALDLVTTREQIDLAFADVSSEWTV